MSDWLGELRELQGLHKELADANSSLRAALAEQKAHNEHVIELALKLVADLEAQLQTLRAALAESEQMKTHWERSFAELLKLKEQTIAELAEAQAEWDAERTELDRLWFWAIKQWPLQQGEDRGDTCVVDYVKEKVADLEAERNALLQECNAKCIPVDEAVEPWRLEVEGLRQENADLEARLSERERELEDIRRQLLATPSEYDDQAYYDDAYAAGEKAVLDALRIVATAESWGAALGAVAEDYPELDELTKHIADKGKKAERERCAKIVCTWCRAGKPLSQQHPSLHEWIEGGMPYSIGCNSTAIRAEQPAEKQMGAVPPPPPERSRDREMGG